MTSPSGPAGRTAADGAMEQASQPLGADATDAARATPVSAGSHPAAEAGQRRYDRGPLWALALPPVAALAAFLWGVTTPSFWRDEAATISAVQRPYPDLLSMLGHVDAVHGLYYSIMWPLVHLFGPTEFVLRLPSVLAGAVTAAVLAAIGRRLISPWAGLGAGLGYVLLPVTSRYAQEGRPYGMVMMLATISTYLLVRLVQAAPEDKRRWLFRYGVGLTLLGIMNIFGLLMIPAHAITLALHYRRSLRDPQVRRLGLGWLTAAIIAVVVVSPILAFAWKEQAQIAWLAVNTSSSGPMTVVTLPGSILVSGAAVVVVAIALVVSLDATRERRRAAWPAALAEVSLPWLIGPPAILFAASVVKPVYTSRYILMCIPALALIIGAAAAALGKYIGPLAAAIILLAGMSTQMVVRMPYGHYDNIRALDHIVAARQRPGDVVLYTNPNAETFGMAYSYGLGTLPNIELKRGRIPSGTLAGTPVSLPVLRSRLRQVSRVWLVEINRYVAQPQMLGLSGLPEGYAVRGLPLKLVHVWHERGDWLLLYQHG
jgi:mannosyltransferase